MLKTYSLLVLCVVTNSSTALAAHGNKDWADTGENPCLSVANTCSVSGFKGKDVWKKCVEPLKRGKKVVTADGTLVAPDVPDSCKNAKPGEGADGKKKGEHSGHGHQAPSTDG